MTDAAIVADSAPAPVDVPVGAPINENGTNFNAPLGSQIPPDAIAKPDAAPQPKSLDDSIDRAIAKSAAVSRDTAKPDADAKPVAKEVPAKEPPARADSGKFAPKEPTAPAAQPDAKSVEVKPSHTADEPPARFTETAKAKWASADPEIRGEVQRMQRELTDGYQKHREAAERDSKLTEFHDMAKQSGKELPGVVREYVNMENLLRKDPAAGIEQILARVGLSPRQYAEHIMGQSPDQAASQQDATIRELKNTVAALQHQIGGVSQTIQEQRTQSTHAEVTKFAADHPRFEELADDIAFFMKTGRATDLPGAYELAERLNPAPAQASAQPAASSAAAPAPSAQPDKGQKSINGAPSTGSTPAAKKRVALSLDESLDRAFGSVG